MSADPKLSAAFARQAEACAALGSPFMAGLMALLPEVWPEGTALAARLSDWEGDVGPAGASLPLRLAGGLHALVLMGAAPALAEVWPPRAGDPRGPVAEALAGHAGFWADWIEQPPQTNETGRSAVLIAAAAWLGARLGLPLRLSELGASAGLNLNFDRYALETPAGRQGAEAPALTLRPDWHGALPKGRFTAAERRGADLNPLHPARDGLRLMAYVWADQPGRLARLEAALAQPAAPVDRADAADWLEARLAEPWEGRCHLVFHTIAHQYFAPETQARIAAAMEAAGARSPDPLAWLAMEADCGRGAAVTLRLWQGGAHSAFALGRAGFHGEWVDWRA
jgi:hypothetical protein